MRIDIHHYIHFEGCDPQQREILAAISNLKGTVMATSAEFAQQLRDLKAQNDKARQEVLDKIAALQKTIDDHPVDAEVQAAFDELKASVQQDDDIVPDAPPPPPAEEPQP